MRKHLVLIMFCTLLGVGCATLFGWNIHAPGILSAQFYEQITPLDQRLALYLPDTVSAYVSHDKGGRLADPQIYYVGEAFQPMILEACQGAFTEFIFIEEEPTDVLLKQYAIPYLIVIDIIGFDNRVTIKEQSLALKTTVLLFDDELNLRARFEAEGSSQAPKVFGKRGGPEVNLNAALENNIKVTVQLLHDLFMNPDTTFEPPV